MICPGLVQCETCGMSRHEGHPIDVCSRCSPEEYARRFTELRARAAWTYFVGHDIFSDHFYFESEGTVFRVEGQMMRFMPGRVPDAAIAEMTKLKTENTELLAENARLRRRLEGK